MGETRITTTVFEPDLNMLKTIAKKEGYLWPQGSGKKEGSMDSAATIHHVLQDYLGRRP